jgi:hypothetical protein
MPRRCERPSCSTPAAVAYGFDAGQSSVWLEAVSEADAERINAGVLCRRHADALRPPRGWFLDDRREARPRLFPAPIDDGAPVAARPRRIRRTRVIDITEELPFPEPASSGQVESAPSSAPESGATVDAVEETSSIDEPDPDETEALPWTPVFDQNDDLGGLLAARGPLLSRAFGRRPDRATPT